MNIKKQIGTRIKELRLKNNLLQSELAEKVGIAVKHQSCIETGRNFPSAELFEKYAKAFNIDVSELLSYKPMTSLKSRKDLINNIVTIVSSASDYELSLIEKIINAILEK